MAFNFKDHSAAAAVPSSTSNPSLANFTIPSLLTVGQGKSTWLFTTAAVVLALLALEQTVWRYKRRHLPGDRWTIPIIGRFANSVHPTMQNYKKQWDSGALSAVTVFNIFIVMASSNEYSRKILNSPSYAEPCLVHSAKQVLQPDNWVFLNGKNHIEYRRSLNALFTKRALGIYLPLQEVVARKHISRWLADAAKAPSPMAVMMRIRQMNMETSLRVFCGNHIPEQAAIEICDKYWAITKALELVNFPLAIPGTKVWSAIQARKVAMKWLELAAKNSKINIAKGREPECMMEEWISILADPAYKGTRKDFSDREMAMVVFSFLFASQDAMSSGLTYGLQHLADHPEILAKVRQEQERVRQGDYERPLTLDMMEDMTYLYAVVKESMRVKPPVVMVPYKATKAFPIAENYTVPANSMVIPSFYNSLHDPEVYPDPDEFKPERWLDAEGSANANPKNYLVYGAGPHRCIGQEYSNMNIALVMATAATMMNFEHDITPLSDEVEIIATIFPKDGLRLKMSPRTN